MKYSDPLFAISKSCASSFVNSSSSQPPRPVLVYSHARRPILCHILHPSLSALRLALIIVSLSYTLPPVSTDANLYDPVTDNTYNIGIIVGYLNLAPCSFYSRSPGDHTLHRLIWKKIKQKNKQFIVLKISTQQLNQKKGKK